MMRLHLTDTDEAALLAAAELPDDFGYMNFKGFISRGVPASDTRRVVRKLARMRLMQFASGLWTDDGEPAGAGYGLTDYGRAIAQAIEARRATTHSGVVADERAMATPCAQNEEPHSC